MLEAYDPKKHDAPQVAELIYDTDPEFNLLVFGKRDVAVGMIRKLMDIPGTFYAAPHLRCVVTAAGVLGIVSGYPVKARGMLERNAGKAFVRLFGFAGFLKRLPVLLKMGRILSGRMAKTGYYIVYVCILETARGHGLGRAVIQELAAAWPMLYLHVAIDNLNAIHFYESNRFRTIGVKTGRIGKAGVGARLMERASRQAATQP